MGGGANEHCSKSKFRRRELFLVVSCKALQKTGFKDMEQLLFPLWKRRLLNRNSTYKAFRTVVWNLSVRKSYLLKMQTSRPHPEIGI